MAKQTVRQLRTARGMTMETLSLRSGVNYHDLSRIERGVTALSPRAAALLAPVLEVDAEKLLRAHTKMREALIADAAESDPEPAEAR